MKVKILLVILMIMVALALNISGVAGVESESEPLVMESGVQYSVSQILEKQNQGQGVFLLPMVETYDGEYMIPQLRNIYFSEMRGGETIVRFTALVSRPTVAKLTFYNLEGQVIYEESIASRKPSVIPKEIAYFLTGRHEDLQILDEMLSTEVPTSIFKSAETFSIG